MSDESSNPTTSDESSNEDDDSAGSTRHTDCCNNIYDAEDTETCPDCGHVCCTDCEVSASRGLCWCKHSVRGDAKADQTSESGRKFLRSTFGYRGKFKPMTQVRMEKDLSGRHGPSKARLDHCSYSLCNRNTPPEEQGQSKDNSRTKLTDETLELFVLCEKCRSVAYCSMSCRDADANTETWQPWDGKTCTHADLCEPYMDNDRMPYVSVALRQYKKEFGRYPHPLGLGGEKETDKEKK